MAIVLKTKKPTEHEIQNECLDWLAVFGHIGVRINSGAVKATAASGKTRFIRFNDTPGCSDILACVEGTFFAIEIKRPGAKTDALRLAKQQHFGARVEKSGGVSLFVTSLNEMIDGINEHRNKKNAKILTTGIPAPKEDQSETTARADSGSVGKDQKKTPVEGKRKARKRP
jgi:hypothetical protein